MGLLSLVLVIDLESFGGNSTLLLLLLELFIVCLEWVLALCATSVSS